MRLDDFNFELPSRLIARYPLASRSASRLLIVDPAEGGLSHKHFNDVVDLIHPGDLLVFNDTKVIPARLMGHKTTGGQVEVLVERILDERRMLAQLRVSKAPKMGDGLHFFPDICLEVRDRQNQFYELQYNGCDRTILEVIESVGQIPLPPYLHRLPDESDKTRYQTVYARHKGSVAAPTAGFHFDQELLEKLCAKQVKMGYLTLHIGAGTFQPVRAQDIRQHQMHAEYLDVPAALCEQIAAVRARGNRVIAVGTTSMRALETACQSGQMAPYQGETSIFIYPGYPFRCADAMITNLHLPCSSLLMLVGAFGGHQTVMQAYREAVAQGYRFYSYGDAMWIVSHSR